jgi:hypothetical protein
VDAVGPDFYGEAGVVVEDEGDSGGAAEGDEFLGDAADGGEVVALGAELEEMSTAVEERLGDGFGVFLGGVAEVEDAVETHRMKRKSQRSKVLKSKVE